MYFDLCKYLLCFSCLASGVKYLRKKVALGVILEDHIIDSYRISESVKTLIIVMDFYLQIFSIFFYCIVLAPNVVTH